VSEATAADWLAAVAAVGAALAAILAVVVGCLQWDATRRQTRIAAFDLQYDIYRNLSETIAGMSLVVTDEEREAIRSASQRAVFLFDPMLEEHFHRLADLARNASIARANRQQREQRTNVRTTLDEQRDQQEDRDVEDLRALWQQIRPLLREDLREWRKPTNPMHWVHWVDDAFDWLEGKHR